jgi:hypothetical protein
MLMERDSEHDSRWQVMRILDFQDQAERRLSALGQALFLLIAIRRKFI